ncbi:hypothetical protein C2G38_2218865 [Gigaspora rosea]|uniref:Uncharacterized protein n=1 Tax=Gigaspora rosea TaxID=44941 RepID=A0A397U5Z8_9GLOM|nr:hypothetical protein C2G38_2218865 [Gigaspora rosea]
MIAKSAFSTATVSTMTPEHCVFMLAVCDIILNPNLKYVKCTKKLIKRCLKRYLDDLNREGPSYGSAQAFCDDCELTHEKWKSTTLPILSFIFLLAMQ